MREMPATVVEHFGNGCVVCLYRVMKNVMIRIYELLGMRLPRFFKKKENYSLSCCGRQKQGLQNKLSF